MTNKEIAAAFNLLAKLMELQGENPYKIRSYQNAYGLLSKLATPLVEMTTEEIGQLKGVGSAISGKIQELLQNGQMKTLERYKDQVPPGIQEMLLIRGIFNPDRLVIFSNVFVFEILFTVLPIFFEAFAEILDSIRFL
jgi:DNA polymerase (family 10)